MSCCGRMRALIGGGGKAAVPNRPQPTSRGVLYEYSGSAGMTVTGRISGHTYPFAPHARRIQIDPRDVPWLAGLPDLRPVR